MDSRKKTNFSILSELILNSESSYIGRVKGESMKESGIDDGDWLLVDQNLPVYENCIGIFQLDGKDVVRRYREEGNSICLIADNEEFESIRIPLEEGIKLSGIAIYVIKNLNN